MPQSTLDATATRISAPPVLEVVRQRALDLLLAGSPVDGPLSQMVDVDAVLTGLRLRLVRCPLYDGSEQRGIDASQAMQRIGRQTLVDAVTYLPGLPDRQTREAVERACSDWVHAIAVAAAAKWLANSGEYEDPREAFVAGLLHDIGGRCGRSGADAADAVRRLSERWHLGARISRVARIHESLGDYDDTAEHVDTDERTTRLIDVVRRACRIAVALGFSSRPATSDPGLRPTVVAAEESVRLEVNHAAALLGLDSGEPEDLARLLANEEMRLGDLEHLRQELGANADLLAEAHRRIAGSRRLGSVADVVGRGLLAIREGLEFDRVILLDAHPTEPFRYQGRAVSDPSDLTYAGGVHGLALELDGGGVLQQVMERGRALLGSCDQRDARVKAQLGVESFAGAVLRAGNTPMGLVIADRFFTGEPVRPADVLHLEILCDALGLVLDNNVLDAQGRKLRTLAEKDELTGINNRRNIVNILNTEVERARRFGNPLSIALLDVDHFKRWNDIHGHQVGDMVLQAVAQLIAACSREIDHYGRYGGEEFLVVLPETAVQHAVLYAERLRVTLEGHCADMFTNYAETPLSVSIGVTELRDEDEVEQLVRRADTAMYAAKDHGRNRVCVEMGASAEAGEPDAS